MILYFLRCLFFKYKSKNSLLFWVHFVFVFSCNVVREKFFLVLLVFGSCWNIFIGFFIERPTFVGIQKPTSISMVFRFQMLS